MELKLNYQNVISSNKKSHNFEYFGRLISAEGYTVVTRTTKALKEKIRKGLTNISELRSLLSLIGYLAKDQFLTSVKLLNPYTNYSKIKNLSENPNKKSNEKMIIN